MKKVRAIRYPDGTLMPMGGDLVEGYEVNGKIYSTHEAAIHAKKDYDKTI